MVRRDGQVVSVDIDAALVESGKERLAGLGYRLTLAEGATRPTSVTVDVLDGGFGMFAALRVPAQRLGIVPGDGPEQGWLLGADGSWACQTAASDGTPTVTSAGPVDLWALLENAHAEWDRLGRPPRQAFGLTVGPEGHALWLESPGSGHGWDLGR